MNLHKLIIPTTRHAVQLLSITIEDPKIKSVVCLNDSFQALPISAEYDQFVRRPTGIIEKLLGPAAYRIDVSAPITQGDSWQLGLCLAHIFHHHEIFTGINGGDGDLVIWATGAVDSKFRINPVDHIATKIAASRDLLEKEILAGKKLVLIVAHENLSTLREHIPEDWNAYGVSSIADACATIGIGMPADLLSKASPTASPTGALKSKRRGQTAIYLMGVLAAAILLLGLNVPFQSLRDSYRYEAEGELRALRMEMRKVSRQKNWVATNAYYFFEVFYLLKKSRHLEQSLNITLQALEDVTNDPQCNSTNTRTVINGSMSSLPDQGCTVKFEVTSNAETNVRIWLALISHKEPTEPLILMKHGADLKPGQRFVTPPITVHNDTTRLVTAISDRSDKAWLKWLENLLEASSAERKELEIDRLTSTGVGVLQTSWQPYFELD